MELAKIRSEKEEQERLKREAEEKAAAEKKLAIEMALRAGHLVQSVAIIQTYDKWTIGKISRQKSLQEVVDNIIDERYVTICAYVSLMSCNLLRITVEYL